MQKELKIWLYQHYKGKHCEVIGLALHSETGEELVIYKNCEDSEQAGEKILRARPYTLFLGTLEQNGKQIPRFKYIGGK